MSPWGDILGELGRPRIGVGQSLPPDQVPQIRPISYEDFRVGIVQMESLEGTPPDAALADETSHMQLSYDGALMAMPGVVEDEDVSPRNPRYIFQQASLDYTTELVIVDPPYIGIRSSSGFVFYNLALGVTGDIGWNGVNIEGILLFSNGVNATYTRNPLAVVVTDISAQVIARTFATMFGRAFAGAYTDPITGLQSLGLRWNAANGDPADWSSTGANEELLVSNSLEADKIVALRPLGFDALAILCYNSLWIGYPTGDPDRPADPRIRYTGFGCVAEPTAVVTPHGVAYLALDGVRLFDTNQCKLLSAGIDALLLPIDTTNLASYSAVYDSNRDRYILTTPTGVIWYYEFENEFRPARWLKRELAGLTKMILFTDQNTNITWATVQGTWATQIRTWDEMVQTQTDTPPRLFYIKDTKLGVEFGGIMSFFGTAFDVKWQTPESAKGPMTEVFTTVAYELEYALEDGGAAQIELWNMDPDGLDTGGTDLELAITLPADPTGRKRRTRCNIEVARSGATGMGSILGIRLTGGLPLIYRLRQMVIDSGPGFNSIAQ